MERRTRFADDRVERVRSATDIVEYIGSFVTLKRAGRSYKGLCPFHNERTPSFMVNPDRQMYHCFGCHRGGDVFSFAMEHDGTSFLEALRALGARAGIEIETRSESREANDGLYAAAERAARFFVEVLAAPAGEAARRYARERGLTPATIERFRLGAAPNAWDEMSRALRTGGITDETLVTLGLAARSTKGHGVYDSFRNRLVIPIESLSGRVIGFGGRALPGGADEGPKYLNTADSPIYHKGQVLYGLAAARGAIRRQDGAILTEGYMDTLSLVQAGIENVVAACGTAFTRAQAALLHRYTRRAYILGDSDPAGRRAAVRTAGLLLEHGFLVYIVELPSGSDPDSFVREYGAEALERRLREAPTYVGYMKLLVDRRAGELAVKDRAVRRLLDDLSRISDPVLQELYLKELGRGFALSDRALASAVAGRRGRQPGPEGARPEEIVRGPAAMAQRALLRLGLLDGSWAARLAAELTADDFESGPPRRLFEVLAGPEGRAGAWLDQLEGDGERAFASELALEEIPAGEPERLYRDYVVALRGARLEATERDLLQRLAAAQERGDHDAERDLQQRHRALVQERMQLRQRDPHV
jgi:DNA primase